MTGLPITIPHHRRFVRIPMPDIKMLKVDVRAFVTDEGELYLFPYESGDLYRFSLNSFDQDTLSTRLTTTPSHFHSKQIQYCLLSEWCILFL